MRSQKISDIAAKKSPESIQEAANVYFDGNEALHQANGDSLKATVEAFTTGFEEGVWKQSILADNKTFVVEIADEYGSSFAVAYFIGTEESVIEKLNKLEDATCS